MVLQRALHLRHERARNRAVYQAPVYSSIELAVRPVPRLGFTLRATVESSHGKVSKVLVRSWGAFQELNSTNPLELGYLEKMTGSAMGVTFSRHPLFPVHCRSTFDESLGHDSHDELPIDSIEEKSSL